MVRKIFTPLQEASGFSCGGIQVDSTKSKGVDLEKYKTYAWGRPERNGSNGNTKKVYSGLIRKLADAELLKKGFVLDTLKPDAIFVSIQVWRNVFLTIDLM